MACFVQQNGDTYSGEFDKDNKKNGIGTYTFNESGAVYYGTFVDEKITGEGVLRFSNGDLYEGSFLDNKFHGEGKYFFSNGDQLEGRFSNGTLEGFGIYKSNGQTWEGNFYANQGAVGLKFHL